MWFLQQVKKSSDKLEIQYRHITLMIHYIK
jgi:hypothetical protein